MEIKRAFHEIKEAGAKVLFGPKIEGVIEEIKKDEITSDLWHVLVRTKDDKREHIIYPDVNNTPNGPIYFSGFIGKEISSRKHEFYMFPWKKYERDPFGLNN